jgi:PIN domain nuclease of toxin-antitoxin system
LSILIDTNVFLWLAGIEGRLSEKAKAFLDDSDEMLFLSAASAWEIAIKWSKGRLTLPAEPAPFINEVVSVAELSKLSITIRDSCAVSNLPRHHKDPFDRLLVAQAQIHGLRLLTADPTLERYDVDVIALWRDENDD